MRDMEPIKDLFGNLNFTELIVGGMVGAIITLLLNRALSFFRMKRAKYCISTYHQGQAPAYHQGQ